MKSQQDRIFEKIEISPSGEGCWIWAGAKINTGYGVINLNGKMALAHRIVPSMFGNTIPKGMMACHKCDVRACVNPSHIYAGTRQQNTKDAIDRNRYLRGEKHPSTKYTDEQVKMVKKLYASGMMQKDIADMIGASRGWVCIVVNGKKRSKT